MAPSFQCVLVLSVIFLSALNTATAATCSDCFIPSRAAYYPNSDEKGTESKILNYEHLSHTNVQMHLVRITAYTKYIYIHILFLNTRRGVWVWHIWSNY